MKSLTLYLLLALAAPALADRILYVSEATGDTTLVAVLTKPQVTTLEWQLLSISKWIAGALYGKENNVRTRFLDHWRVELSKDPEVDSIPANEDLLIDFVSKRPGYQSRAEAEAAADTSKN